MKKLALAVVVAAIAASPAMAAKKSKKAKPAPAASASNNENSWRFVKDSLPVFLPSWSIPIYMSAKNQKS
jgi:opacity protein-like surface antigen